MTVFIDTSLPRVSLTDKTKDFYGDHVVWVEDNMLKFKGYLNYDNAWGILGIRPRCSEGYDGNLLSFLKLCIDRNWTIEIVGREGAQMFKAGTFSSLYRKRISAISDIDFKNGSLVIERKRRHSHGSETIYVRDADILGFKLRPRSVVDQKAFVPSGEITLTRSYEQYHSYFIDGHVLDSRLMEGIADFTAKRSDNKAYADVHRAVQIGNTGRYIIQSPEDFAIVVGMVNSPVSCPSDSQVNWENLFNLTEQREMKMLDYKPKMMIAYLNDNDRWHITSFEAEQLAMKEAAKTFAANERTRKRLVQKQLKKSKEVTSAK